MNIRQFANVGRSKKKCPIRRSCVAVTSMEVGVTTVEDGEMPVQSTAQV